MGIQTLPNGTEFFSLSEELQSFVASAYQIFTPFNAGIMLIVSVVLIGLIAVLAFYIAKKQIEAIV